MTSHGPRSLGRKVDSFFWRLHDLYHALKPLRFALIVTVLGAGIFLYVEQGREVLRALAEPGTRTGSTGATRLLLFAVGLVLWSISSWYSARVLLYFDFPKTHVWHPQHGGIWLRIHEWLRLHLPRIFGIAPMVIVGWSFLATHRTYETNAPVRLLYFGWAAFGVGALLYLFFIGRRRLLKRNEKASGSDTAKEYESMQQLKGTSRLALVLMLGISLALALMFIIDPVRFAGGFGTGAVLVFAAACWVFWGSMLIYIGSRKHVPVLLLIAVWIALCTLGNDNHAVRVVPRDPFVRTTVRQAVADWSAGITAKYPGRTSYPMFLVATEGGGIRAAYWTATVLGSLQDVDPTFADHVFAISAVSGGSLGTAVFSALLADGARQGEFAQRGQMILGQDFLSPAIAAMLYPDFFQRGIPFPISFLDRGRWLERGWEKAWQNTMHNDRFARPFFDLWRDPHRYVPALMLNGTSVEVGNRIIASNLLIDEGFLEAADATGKLFPLNRQNEQRRPTLDMPLSTAAHMSARFTYVSPAGRFAPDGSHVVDGGYFENSGAATALDILRQVHDELRQNNQLHAIVPHVIMISNDPLGVASGSRMLAATKEMLRTLPKSTNNEAQRRRPGTFLEDLLAPAHALLSAREARGDYAQRAIGRAQKDFCDEIDASSTNTSGAALNCLHFFSLAPAKVPLPLGWMLSNRAAEAMQQEMFDQGLSEKAPVPTWNQAELKQIVTLLHANISSLGPVDLGTP